MMEGPDYSDLEAQFAVSEDFGCDSVIVVSGLPLVTAAKEEKLSAVIAKIFKNVGKVAPGGVFMPKDASGQSKGYEPLAVCTACTAHAFEYKDLLLWNSRRLKWPLQP